MTSSPQTRQRNLPAQESRRRSASNATSATADGSASARVRQSPTPDPSSVFGCVDWFLYPDQAVGGSALG
jgi:hypothetical protein